MVTQAANNYWSSTENSDTNAWNFNANWGIMNNNNKSNANYVRPCFAFREFTKLEKVISLCPPFAM